MDSDMDGREALRLNLLVCGGDAGFSPEVDFWTRRLPGLAARKVIVVVGDATAWLYVCERNGCATLLEGGEAGGAVIRRSCDMDEIGGVLGDFARSLLMRDGERRAAGGRGGALLLRDEAVDRMTV